MIFLHLTLIFFPILALFAESWAEKTFAELAIEQKIGQLFMLPACPLRGEEHERDWVYLFDRFHIGNAIVKQSDPLTQVDFLNRLQSLSNIPLLIAADAEWGLGMRMSDTLSFPKNRTLGAIKDAHLLNELGKEIAREAKRVGIHINLAPVADVNTNPANPIIGMRAFGEDPFTVAKCVAEMVKGLQSEGVIACAKHFPGHGDTSLDSHRTLPVVLHTRERLNEVEFFPFKSAIDAEVGAIMTAHLLVPSIDPNLPSSLSYECLTGILRKELHFEGLIISDALNMKALALTPEEIAVEAFQAGCDLLLYGDHIAPRIDQILREDIPKAWMALKRGFEDGTLSMERLDESVGRILRAKERLGLHFSTHLNAEGLLESLHEKEALSLKKRLFQEAIVLQGDLRPLPRKTAYLAVGDPSGISQAFNAVYSVAPDLDAIVQSQVLQQLKGYDAVVIGIHKFDSRKPNYGFSQECIDLIRAFPNAVLCLFGTPYSLSIFSHPGPILIGFENDPDAQEAALAILLGH